MNPLLYRGVFEGGDNRPVCSGILRSARRTCPRRTQDTEAASLTNQAGFLDSKCMFGLQSLGALALGTVFLCCSGAICPLCAQTTGTLEPESDSLRGTVVNSLNHEPIARALVYSPDNRYATITDSQGHFEFKFARAEREPAPGPGTTLIIAPAPSYPRYAATDRPSMLMARKTGFLPDNIGQQPYQLSETQQELTIAIAPGGC